MVTTPSFTLLKFNGFTLFFFYPFEFALRQGRGVNTSDRFHLLDIPAHGEISQNLIDFPMLVYILPLVILPVNIIWHFPTNFRRQVVRRG